MDELLEEQDAVFLDEEQEIDPIAIAEPDVVEAAEVEEEYKAANEHSDDAIRLYLREIQKTKLLTAEQERELAALIDQGDKAARDRMIVSNLRLVVKIAKRYMNRGLPFLDLIEEGNLGLIKAVERFKLSKECRFSTYATWWIRQSIERALVNQSRVIRLPVHVSDDINRMLRVSRELVHKMNREPSTKELADALCSDVAQVRKLMVLLKKTFSIECPLGESNDYSLMDTIEDTTAVSPAAHLEELNRYELVSERFDILSETEKKVLTLRFGLQDGEPQTLDIIGRSFGVTRERIRQIEAKALEKLRLQIDVIDVRQQRAV